MIRPMISYHNEDIDFIFKHKRLNNKWLSMVAGSEMKKIGEIDALGKSLPYQSRAYLKNGRVHQSDAFR